MKKYNILFVFHVPFIPFNGGVERVTDILCRAFVAEGHSVLYLSSERREMDFQYPTNQYYFPDSDYMSKDNVQFYNTFLIDKKIDIVINQNGSERHSYLYLNILRNNHLKVISVIHTNPLVGYRHHQYALIPLWVSFSIKDMFNYLVKTLLFPFRFIWRRNMQYFRLKCQYDYVSKHSDIVLLLSERFFDDMCLICPSSKKKLRSISNPISYSLPKTFLKKKQILYVGRFGVTEKRPDRLLKVWKRIHKQYLDWELVFIGYGGLEYYMRAYVKRHKLERVFFVGQCEPKSYYETATILCLTSSYEGLGMVLLEAMQHKVIPIAFDSYASVRDVIIPEETGLLVSPFDLDEYACQLAALMSSPSKRLKLAEQAYAYVRKYSIRNITAKWEKLFVEIMDKDCGDDGDY